MESLPREGSGNNVRALIGRRGGGGGCGGGGGKLLFDGAEMATSEEARPSRMYTPRTSSLQQRAPRIAMKA